MSSAIYPTLGQAQTLRKVAASTGNVLTEPQVTTLAAGEYSESAGFGGMPVDIVIKNIGSGASGAGDQVTIEICTLQTFASGVVTPAEFGLVDFKSYPIGGAVNVRNVEGANQFWRIKNTATVSIQVAYFPKPNRD